MNHLTGVVAGLVPATPNVEAQSRNNGVAGTSPATTESASLLHVPHHPLRTDLSAVDHALGVSDLDITAQALTVTGKYGRKRLIALHPSAAAALSDYLRFREQHAADGTAPASGAVSCPSRYRKRNSARRPWSLS